VVNGDPNINTIPIGDLANSPMFASSTDLDQHVFVNGIRVRPVTRTFYQGDEFRCDFLGGPFVAVSARNLNPNLDAIAVQWQSFDTTPTGGGAGEPSGVSAWTRLSRPPEKSSIVQGHRSGRGSARDRQPFPFERRAARPMIGKGRPPCHGPHMPSAATPYDAIVLGAGGAGLMCAATAGQRGRRVLLIDHADRPGRKILISGGGRCNFTNLHAAPDRFLSANRHFAKSALGRYRPEDFIALVDRHRVQWHEKTLGQLFCDGSARQIVHMLMEECAKGGVRIALGGKIADVSHADGRFIVRHGDETANAPALVIATGGPSIPKMGATGFAYDLAQRFGLALVEPRPALVPLTLGEDETLFRSLSGVAADVVARCGKAAFREAALFTHRGLSGPAILQISSYWRQGEEIGVDFLPSLDRNWPLKAKRARPRIHFHTMLGEILPDRLAEALAKRIGLWGELANIADRKLEEAARRLADWRFRPEDSEGFGKAEVTAGGIDTAGLSSQTMAARAVPGLYAIGEAVDVTGWLGGYNFQWAWASGWAAGQAI
jgi:predicted Rossmann fold flavoprotein